jgi:hypothetical protein
VAPVGSGAWRHGEETDVVAHQSVRHRVSRVARAIAETPCGHAACLTRSWRSAAFVVAAGCSLLLTTFASGVAVADPPPPEPFRLELSITQGTPETSFTATATGVRECSLTPSGRNLPQQVTFGWSFERKTVTAESDIAEVTFTVPGYATPDTYQVTASCASTESTATFTVSENPSLLLSPEQGSPGTRVAATAKGFDSCVGSARSLSPTLSWQWDGGPLPNPTGAAGLTVTFEVPIDAKADTHTVTASCGDRSAQAPFTVVQTAKPALTLDKNEGPRGSQLTATGTGFACGDGDDSVQLRWDANTLLSDGPSGTFSIPLKVPADASIGQHTVVASCRNHADITDSQPFTVTKDTVAVTDPAAVTLHPASGHPGDPVRVTGERFTCNNSRTVELSWDGQPLSSLSTDASGRFDTSITVPADAPAVSHTVRASCSAGSSAATAGFTVITGPIPRTTPPTVPITPPPQTSSTANAGWLILPLIIGAVIVAVLAYRYTHKPRPKPKPDVSRVYAAARAAGFPVVTMRETPANGEITHVLRLQAHADLGTQTISEVDDDHTTQ